MYGLTRFSTGLTADRLAQLIAISFSCSELPGDFAEFGVFKGGSLELLAKMHPDRVIYGIDSFEGLPAPGMHDLHQKGEFAVDYESLSELVNYFAKHHPKVKIHQGFSPEVFRKEELEMSRYAFVHVDVDLYQSVKDALDFFWPRMVPGGVMLFDDYGFDTTPGAKLAVDEWVKEQHIRSGPLKFREDWFTGQYYILK